MQKKLKRSLQLFTSRHNKIQKIIFRDENTHGCFAHVRELFKLRIKYFFNIFLKLALIEDPSFLFE